MLLVAFPLFCDPSLLPERPTDMYNPAPGSDGRPSTSTLHYRRIRCRHHASGSPLVPCRHVAEARRTTGQATAETLYPSEVVVSLHRDAEERQFAGRHFTVEVHDVANHYFSGIGVQREWYRESVVVEPGTDDGAETLYAEEEVVDCEL